MNTQDSDVRTPEPHQPRSVTDSSRKPGSRRVAVLGDLPAEAEKARRWLNEVREVELVDPSTGEPEVLFCVAASAWNLVAQLDPFGYPYPPPVLLDLVYAIGPTVAALHGIFGYLTPACPQSRWPDAIGRASRKHLYALAPDDEAFVEQWRAKPLTEADRQLLRLAPLGLKKKAMVERLGNGWNDTKLYRAGLSLRQRLGLEEDEELAAAAVELGLYRFWRPRPRRP